MMDAAGERQLSATLARVLRFGTQFASFTIACGLALQWLRITSGPAGRFAVTSGLALFLLLPCIRVSVTLFAFVRTRDYRFAAAAGLVLLIILLSLSIGALAPSGFPREHEGRRDADGNSSVRQRSSLRGHVQPAFILRFQQRP